MFKNFHWTKESKSRNDLMVKYEPIQPFLFLSFSELCASEYVFDIGSNIGAYSLFATLLPNLKEIHAFEAEQFAYESLIENIKLNKAENRINPHLLAISSFSGTLDFAISAPRAGINAVRFTSFHNPKYYFQTKAVECSALDDLFFLEDLPVSLKIDVEGHEAEVLKGAEKLLENNTCLVQIEIYKNLEAISSLLKNLGYEKIFAAHHDYYFSNHGTWADESNIINAVEHAISMMIAHNLQKS